MRNRILEIVIELERCGYEPYEYQATGSTAPCLAVDCENPIECVMDLIREACDDLDDADDIGEMIDFLGAARVAEKDGSLKTLYFPDVELSDDF